MDRDREREEWIKVDMERRMEEMENIRSRELTYKKINDVFVETKKKWTEDDLKSKAKEHEVKKQAYLLIDSMVADCFIKHSDVAAIKTLLTKNSLKQEQFFHDHPQGKKKRRLLKAWAYIKRTGFCLKNDTTDLVKERTDQLRNMKQKAIQAEIVSEATGTQSKHHLSPLCNKKESCSKIALGKVKASGLSRESCDFQGSSEFVTGVKGQSCEFSTLTEIQEPLFISKNYREDGYFQQNEANENLVPSVETKSKYTCNKCGTQFSKELILKIHMAVHE